VHGWSKAQGEKSPRNHLSPLAVRTRTITAQCRAYRALFLISSRVGGLSWRLLLLFPSRGVIAASASDLSVRKAWGFVSICVYNLPRAHTYRTYKSVYRIGYVLRRELSSGF
jgi:hypothetical protein